MLNKPKTHLGSKKSSTSFEIFDSRQKVPNVLSIHMKIKNQSSEVQTQNEPTNPMIHKVGPKHEKSREKIDRPLVGV